MPAEVLHFFRLLLRRGHLAQIKAAFTAEDDAPAYPVLKQYYDPVRNSRLTVLFNDETDEYEEYVETFNDHLFTILRPEFDRVIAQMDNALLRADGPKGKRMVGTIYLDRLREMRTALGRYQEADGLPVIRTCLDRIEELVLERTGVAGSGPGRKVGRRLDPAAPQAKIEELVAFYASQPGYGHKEGERAGQPEPTTIRDRLLAAHPEVCGELSERALFDRVRRVLSSLSLQDMQ